MRVSVRLAAVLLLALPWTLLAQRTHQVLLISDTHFNPFPTEQQCTASADLRRHMAEMLARGGDKWTAADFGYQAAPSHHGDDTNWPLLRSSFAAAHKALPNPDAILISGDLLVHHPERWMGPCFPMQGDLRETNTYRSFLLQIIRFQLELLRDSFKGVPVIVALGNNDTDTGDYKLPSPDFLVRAEPLYARAAGRVSSQMLETFATGGYYAATPSKLGRDEVLVLNSNAFSTQAQRGDAQRSGPAAKAQLQWLTHELAEAKEHHRHVLVIGHVPPGLDAFMSHETHSLAMMYGVCARNAQGCTDYAAAIPKLLSDYADTATLGIFGHTHMDDVRLTGKGGMPIEVVPSVSPVVGNNPGFVVLTLGKDLKPIDHASWRLPQGEGASPQWYREYSFRAAYGLPDYSAASIDKLHHLLQEDLKARTNFFTYFNGNSDGAKVPVKWQPAYLCALVNLTPGSVTPCLLEAVGMPFAP